MGREDVELKSAKNAYKQASSTGNKQEEARWANVIGDILKRRGEYVEALRWLRIDYEISVKYLPEKHLLPTCQSLGEVYLRLERFDDALVYQKKHLDLAKEADDLVEQQRASTQLGRTHHEIFLKSEKDHHALRNAKKYFRSALDIASALRLHPPSLRSSSFLKEFIDAHNNLGMLEMDIENLDEALKTLLEGLMICDEEEVKDDDDGRSRLHHNLGCLYMELRQWDKAKVHTERDILICRNIGHKQGEAKGFINLGELHYRVQKYEEALICYNKALKIAKSMEDEDALVDQINQNIETVNQAVKEMEDLKKEEQHLKKLARNTVVSKGTAAERKCLLEQNAALDRLIEMSSMLKAWPKHWDFAKRKKRVAKDLGDKEKLGDSFLAIGESYQNLRNFEKAHKWYTRSWEIYKSIRNMRGQALAKVNIGAALDSDGDWAAALDAFEEGYRISLKANLQDVQILALENMHYSYMIRFDNIEKARELQLEIDTLKEDDIGERSIGSDRCSETETGLQISETGSDEISSLKIPREALPTSVGLAPQLCTSSDDALLSPFSKSSKRLSRKRASNKKLSPAVKIKSSAAPACQRDDQQCRSRKRSRIVISDDEEVEDRRTIQTTKMKSRQYSDDAHIQAKRSCSPHISHASSKDTHREDDQKDSYNVCASFHWGDGSLRSDDQGYAAGNGSNEINNSETRNSPKCSLGKSYKGIDHASENLSHVHNDENNTASTLHDDHSVSITCRIDDSMINFDLRSCIEDGKVSISLIKAQVACLYYLGLPKEKMSRGMLPIVQSLNCKGSTIESLMLDGKFTDHINLEGYIEATISGWIHKQLIRLYVDNCSRMSELPNMKVLRQLYNLEVSEDEVIVSNCGLEDLSVSPLMDALHGYPVAILNLSHNVVGNETMKKLQGVFASSNHIYGGLTLDLHCNRFGASALFQICECPVLFTRLEVLDLSENRLTDACASYLSTILKSCKALYSLSIAKCSVTSRTVQAVADSLEADSVLSQLDLGGNNPISPAVMNNLLKKLPSLKRFSELNLNGIKLGKPTITSLCQFVKNSSLSALMLGSSCLGSDGALQVTESISNGSQEFTRLDISNCSLNWNNLFPICERIISLGVLQLNIGGNAVGEKGIDAVVSLLKDPRCCLKTLVLKSCHLGLVGVLRTLQALSDNTSLEELDLSENADLSQDPLVQYDSSGNLNVESLHQPDLAVVCNEEATPITTRDGEELSLCNSLVNIPDAADSEEDKKEHVEDDSSASSHPPSGTTLARTRASETATRNGESYHNVLASSIGKAKYLQLLDLSINMLSLQVAEELYSSWSAISRTNSLPTKHIDKLILHFSLDSRKCCGFRSCCKRD